MADLLKGQLCLILGIANKWSLAYAVAEAFSREGADLVLTYLGESQKSSLDSLGKNLNVAGTMPCDVTKDEDLAQLSEGLAKFERPLHSVVHSLAFANREDLAKPFVETSREGFLLAQNVSAYSLVAVARATAPLMTNGGSIMTMTYLGSTRVVPMYNVMGVAKAALESSVRYLAADLGARNIRVNAISAGPVKTASARAIKDFSHCPGNGRRALAPAPQHRTCRSRRHRRLPGKFARPRIDRQCAVRRCGYAHSRSVDFR